MTARKVVTSRIIAEVWDRSLVGIPGSEPVSRHRTIAAAERACARQNWAVQFPCGGYPRHCGGAPPYVVYARLPDRREFVELVSWKIGIRAAGDKDWSFPDHRFSTHNEAGIFALDRKTHWDEISSTTVYPSSQQVNCRWDDLTGREVLLANFPPAHQNSPPAPQNTPPALPAIEQALREAGVVVESPDDPTEATRRVLQAQINTEAAAIPEEGSRAHWEAKYGAGNVWSTAEVFQAYTIRRFSAPCVYVTRLSDGATGWLQFAHSPRMYFNFVSEGE